MLEDARLVAFVGVTDAGRAKRFYRDSLGLRLVEETHFGLIFDVGGVTLRVTPVPELNPHPFTVLGWEVGDLDAQVEALAHAGVELRRFPGLEQDERGVWTVPGGGARVAWFADPDGNVLSVSGR